MQSPAELGHTVTADRILLVDPEHSVLVGVERHRLAVAVRENASSRVIKQPELIRPPATQTEPTAPCPQPGNSTRLPALLATALVQVARGAAGSRSWHHRPYRSL